MIITIIVEKLNKLTGNVYIKYIYKLKKKHFHCH